MIYTREKIIQNTVTFNKNCDIWKYTEDKKKTNKTLLKNAYFILQNISFILL